MLDKLATEPVFRGCLLGQVETVQNEVAAAATESTATAAMLAEIKVEVAKDPQARQCGAADRLYLQCDLVPRGWSACNRTGKGATNVVASLSHSISRIDPSIE